MRLAAVFAASAAMVVAGCGGATKTVVRTVTATQSASAPSATDQRQSYCTSPAGDAVTQACAVTTLDGIAQLWNTGAGNLSGADTVAEAAKIRRFQRQHSLKKALY